MVEKEVMQDAHPDLLQTSAFGDLLSAVGVRDKKLVYASVVSRPDLCFPDVQVQIFEGADLQPERRVSSKLRLSHKGGRPNCPTYMVGCLISRQKGKLATWTN